MISVQVSVRSQKVDKYGAQYVEFMSEFDVDRRIEMDRSSQLGTWLDIFPRDRINMDLGGKESKNNFLLHY